MDAHYPSCFFLKKIECRSCKPNLADQHVFDFILFFWIGLVPSKPRCSSCFNEGLFFKKKNYKKLIEIK